MSELSASFVEAGSWLIRIGLVLSPVLLLPLALLLLPQRLDGIGRRLAAAIDWISGGALRVAIAAAILLVIAQIAVIILRYVYGIAYVQLSETVVYLFAIVFMLGIAATLRDDAHVRVDILREKMSPRRRALVDLVGTYIFLFPVTILILESVRPSLSRSWMQFEGSRETSGLPILFLFKTLVPLMAILLLLQGLGIALRAACTIRAPRTATHGEAQ